MCDNMCGIASIGAEVATKFETALKTGQQKDIVDAQKSASKTRLYATAALVASAFFFTLGLLLCATGVGVGGGVALMILSAPALYASYNMYRATTNVKDMLDNVMKYKSGGSQGFNIDVQALKKDLKAGTFLFDWALDLKVESMVYPKA